ncbi:MAG: Fic family protein [Lachnospiraceae bacterium]|nr:Fic family protein [Lachnospiraceae bacterium]
MRDFHYNQLTNERWDTETLGFVATINRFAGKQELYLKQRPAELEKLVEIAKIQSTESSNAIEGIVTTATRIRQLVEEKTTPKNRDEQEIAGYRDALNIIHESFDAIPITRNYILQLHKIMCSHMNSPMAGKTKTVQNYISATFQDGHTEVLFTPPGPVETPRMLDRICEEYNQAIGNETADPLLLIPVFIHDFLCIHPFNDGNGRMSRLLTTLLLYRNGFYVGKYISLEAKIEKSKAQYYRSLRESQWKWEEGMEDIIPFTKYLLGTVVSAYRDFEDRFSLVETKIPALETVRRAAHYKLGTFSKQEVRELCPSLSVSAIEVALRKLVISGELTREGAGKATRYKVNR